MWCKSCGSQLGDPTEDLHDPKGEFLPDSIGAVENPDDYHIKAVYGSKGVRILCSETGDMTKLLEHPPGEGSDGPPSGSPSGEQRQPQGDVYNLQEEKSAEGILKEVIQNPAYELSDSQVAELQSWLRIYDNRIPPDMLEDILKNLKGVSKQKSKLMRQKYEALMNKWIVEQSEPEEGPPIGSVASPPGGGGRPSPRGGPPQQQHPSSRDFNGQSPNQSRQDRRIGRRQEVIDTMAEEMARNMASNAGKFYNDMREVFTTLLKKKAERDPEWFFEKADAFGFDIIDELSQPSSAREQQVNERTAPAVDEEVDDVLEDMINNDQHPPEHPQQPPQQPDQEQPSETHNTVEGEPAMEDMEDIEPEGEREGDAFDEIFIEEGEQ